MTDLVLPQISINGTSRGELVNQQLAVLRAFDTLENVMADAMPNGRDYQFRPAECGPAREAWLERRRIINAMRNEIEQHALAIMEKP